MLESILIERTEVGTRRVHYDGLHYTVVRFSTNRALLECEHCAHRGVHLYERREGVWAPLHHTNDRLELCMPSSGTLEEMLCEVEARVCRGALALIDAHTRSRYDTEAKHKRLHDLRLLWLHLLR